jgi:chromosomal replication initiator protein
VLTCDRLPSQLVAVEERLRERFESGLVADIRAPDFATRVAILRKRAALDQIRLADVGVLELIAQRVTQNIRSLEGALIRVVAHHSLTGRPIDVELTADVLDHMYPNVPSQSVTIGEIQKAVAGYYNLSVAELTSASRSARIAQPRQIAFHLARELTGASLQSIGGAFGGRNHATVLHACKRVSERLASDQQATKELRELSAIVRPRGRDRQD